MCSKNVDINVSLDPLSSPQVGGQIAPRKEFLNPLRVAFVFLELSLCDAPCFTNKLFCIQVGHECVSLILSIMFCHSIFLYMPQATYFLRVWIVCTWYLQIVSSPLHVNLLLCKIF